MIILPLRIAILLLKGYFEREKIIFRKKNLKHRIIILLINFKLAVDRQSKDLGSNPSAVESVIFSTERFSNSLKYLLINFILDPTFFLIASYQILKNYAILINHKSFFQRKDFPQLHRFWFLKINSLMAETIKKTFSKTKFF